MFAHRISPDAELRLLEPRHAEEVFALIDRSRAHLGRWLSWVDSILTADDWRAYTKKCLHRLADNGSPLCGIWYGNSLAGTIDVMEISWKSGYASIGYWLGEEFQGRGLVTGAGRALVGHLFSCLRLNRVELTAIPENRRSCAVAERLGFKNEGTRRQIVKLGGGYTDRRVYAHLKEEWDSAFKPLSFSFSPEPEVELRLLQPCDAEALFNTISESRDFLRPWLRFAEEEPQSVENYRGFIVHSLHAMAEETEVVWSIHHRGKLAGIIGTQRIDWANRKVELGYWLGRGFEGKGLMTVALREMLAYLFGVIDLNRVELYINPENAPSRKVAQRFGFTHEATKRRCYLSEGHLVDMEVHGLLKSEWERQNT